MALNQYIRKLFCCSCFFYESINSMSEFQKDSLSLEETNKVRISLGLKPLQPDSDDEGGNERKGQKGDDNDDEDDPLKNQDEKAAKNYEQYQENLRREREEKEIRERISKAQNKRELNRKLRGPTLGDAENGVQGGSAGDSAKDTLRWTKALKKKAKENAAKRLKEENEAEEVALSNAAKYDTEDLDGLRVGHDMDEIDLEAGGEGRVLTLKDSKILDGGDDELMDSALEVAEKDRLNAERKKGVKKYTGLDDEEFGAGQVGRKKGVLSKYDNDLEDQGGNKRDDGGFVLGGQSQSRTEREEAKKRQTEQMLNRTLLDLDYTKNVEVSDYLQEGDVGFKKPKTKKKRKAPSRIRLEEDDDEQQGTNDQQQLTNGDVEMAESSSSSAPRRVVRQSETVIDDDDLALSLAKARRDKAKKVFKKMTPEMIAKNLAAQREAEEAERLAMNGSTSAAMETDSIDNGVSSSLQPVKEENGGEGMVFDDTSEFVRNIGVARQTSPEAAARLQRRAAAAAAESSRRQQEEQERRSVATIKEEPASPTRMTTQNGIDAASLLERAPTVKDGDDSDEEMEEGVVDSRQEEGKQVKEEEEDGTAPPEPLVSGGMAGTLSLLRQQGLISEVTAEQRERERKQKEYDAWLATRRFEDRVREAELAASKAQGSAKDQATREYENRMRDLEDARKVQDKFKNYSPDIEIKYTDEFGRTLNNHEAWKRLSHVFHGKEPGQKKQEQRLQRIMDERKREKMLAGDTPSGMTKAFAERAEKSGQAHMVLGVGSKNNAPQEIGLLGPNTVVRPKEKGKEKNRQQAGGSSVVASSSPATAIHSNGTDSSINGITSMIPRSTTTRTKAGFAPIKNATSNSQSSSFSSMGPPSSEMASAAPSKFKMAFSKRPASDQNGASTQPPPNKQTKMED